MKVSQHTGRELRRQNTDEFRLLKGIKDQMNESYNDEEQMREVKD